MAREIQLVGGVMHGEVVHVSSDDRRPYEFRTLHPDEALIPTKEAFESIVPSCSVRTITHRYFYSGSWARVAGRRRDVYVFQE